MHPSAGPPDRGLAPQIRRFLGLVTLAGCFAGASCAPGGVTTTDPLAGKPDGNGGSPPSGPGGTGTPGGTATPGVGGNCTQPPRAADVVIAPEYASTYTAYELGAVPGMPKERYGGLTLKAGDASTLLIGGDANYPDGALYAVRLVRSCGRIVKFEGNATRYAPAPHIDGSLEYGPGGVLFFSGYPEFTLGQISPSDLSRATTTDLRPLGVSESLGSLKFVPEGYEEAGTLRLMTWPTGNWYKAMMSPTAATTGHQLGGVQAVGDIKLVGGPEGFAYVPSGSKLFSKPSLIVSEWSDGNVATYEADRAGNPVPATRKLFLSGLTGAEGAFFDPQTGDFLFSTWNGTGGTERVILVVGFAPIL